MVIYFSQNLYSETSQTFTHSLIIKKQKFQIKILNEMNFFLIIICILMHCLYINVYGPRTFRMHCY